MEIKLILGLYLIGNDSSKLQTVVDVILGLIAVLFSLAALAYSEVVISTIIFLISIALFALGAPRIVSGIFLTDLPNGLRVLNVVIGSIALVVSTISLLFPDLTTQVLIFLLAFGLLLIGVVRLVVGLFFSLFFKWIRLLFVISGCFTIFVASIAFIFPELGYFALVWLFSVSLLVNGIIRIIQGIVKTK